MYFNPVSFLSWYKPSAQYPGQACVCPGFLLWSKWSCRSTSIPGRCHPLGRTAEAFLVIQTAVLLFLTPPQPHGMRSLFPVPLCSRETLRSMRQDVFCCHTCSAPSANGQWETQNKTKGLRLVSLQTDRPAVLQSKTLLPVLSGKPELSHSAQTFLCTVWVTSHPGLACPICKPFNNGNPLSYFAHQNTCRLLPNKRTWQMSLYG